MDPSAIDPNIIYLGLVVSLWIGVTGAYVPGTGIIEGAALLGIAGSIYVLAQMDVNWLAALMIIIGVSGFIVMPFIRTQLAALALGGLALQGLGGLLLFSGSQMVSPLVIGVTLIVPYAYHHWILLPMLRRISEQPVGDKDDLLIGMTGRVVKDLDPIGTVNVKSELWTATSDQPLKQGDPVIVVERNGLQLVVEKVKQKRHEYEQESEV